MSNATISAKAKSTVPAVEAVKVSAATIAALNAAIASDVSRIAAAKVAEKSIIKAGHAIRDAKFQSLDVAKASCKPIVEAAYIKAGQTVMYAGQQLSRMLSIAFPGKKAPTEKARTRIVENLDAAIKSDKVGTNDCIKIANGSARYDAKTEKVIPLKADNRGGKNAKAPLDAYIAAVGNAVTAAAQAKLSLEQVVVAFAAAVIACELASDAEEIRDEIKD